jgi:dolichol-phosphate mannosyltransferase
MRTLIVTPTYQEAENIEEFLRRARAAVPDADVLVVDDNSPDGTGAIAERLAGDLGKVTVLHRREKAGLGEAYRAGFGWGIDRGYERLVQIDADLSHDPGVIPQLLYAGFVLGIKVRDATSGYRAYRAECLRRIDFMGVTGEGVRLSDGDGLPGLA